MPSSKHQHHHHQQQQQQQQQQQVTSATAVAAVVAAQTIKEKQRLCTNCKNHNLRKVWKKHKRYCKYRDCTCPKCTKTAATRKNCAEQTAKRRARQEDEQREQELQLNPANFLDERPIPYTGTAVFGVGGIGVDTAASVSTFRSIGQMSSSSLAAASSTTKASSSRTSEYEDTNSFIDVDVPPADQIIVDDARAGRLENNGEDIDADHKSVAMSDQSAMSVRSMLRDLIDRTKDCETLDAFRLFVLQHNCTYDVDKATKLIKRAHDDFLFLMEEKTQVMNAVRATEDKAAVVHAVVHQTAMQQVRGVNRPPSMSVGHHHHHHHHHQPHHQQQQPLAHLHPHSRTVGSGLVVADFRGEPAVVTTPIMLDPRIVIGGGAGDRRPAINGCSGGGNNLFQPRPVYPIPMPPAAMWHHTPSHFPASNAFAPFIESEWSRHCRLPIFNQEFQPEPVNLQNNNHHRRGGDAAVVQAANRAQEMVVERLERAAHNRVQPVNLQQEDRDHNNRHHA